MTREELKQGLRAWGFGSAEAERVALDLRYWAAGEALKDEEWRLMSEQQRARRRTVGVDRDQACGDPS